MCRHVQRISPVHTTCSVSEVSLHAAVLRIAAQHAAVLQQHKQRNALQHSSQEHLRHTAVPQESAGEEGTAPQAEHVNGSAAKEGSPAEALRVRFAIAFRSRTAEPAPTAAGAAALPDTQKVDTIWLQFQDLSLRMLMFMWQAMILGTQEPEMLEMLGHSGAEELDQCGRQPPLYDLL